MLKKHLALAAFSALTLATSISMAKKHDSRNSKAAAARTQCEKSGKTGSELDSCVKERLSKK